MKPGVQKALSIAQFIFIAAGIAWLSWRASQQAVFDLTNVSPWILGGACAINLVALTLMGWRLKFTAAAWEMHGNTVDFVRINFQSIYYLFLLPGGVGMEAARYVKFRRLFALPQRRSIFFSVLADRGLGLLSALLFACCAWLLARDIPQAGWLALATLSIASLAIALAAHWLSVSFRLLIIGFGASLLVHGLTLLAITLACLALGIAVEGSILVVGLSLGVLGSVVPLAVAGAGLADAGAVAVLVLLGVDPVSAGAIAGVGYLSRFMGAAIGGLWELHA